MDNKKILLLGGSGYIGSFLRETLKYNITSIDTEWFNSNNSIIMDFNKIEEDFLLKSRTS